MITINCRKTTAFYRFNLLASLLLVLYSTNAMGIGCKGRFVNPITDVCWKCLFPLKIAGISIPAFDFKKAPDTARADQPKAPLCFCPTPVPRVGLVLSFWEPVRLVDVTRTAFCFPSMGGISMDPGLSVSGGVTDADESGDNVSIYHVHWYIYPLIYWLNLLVDAVCLESEQFDIAYITELDPTWKNDVLAAILNPEAALFANPVAQFACMGDCAAATVGLPLDALFWCAGCQGSAYPLSGHVQAHVGGVQASLLLTERMVYKLHRQGLLFGSVGDEGLCQKYPMPIWKKSQYRSQMTFPIPGVSGEPYPCSPFGRSSALYESGRELPFIGEDFGWLIWRKRDCCAL
jgi:conjugal transfer pilus assembly protein TraU